MAHHDKLANTTERRQEDHCLHKEEAEACPINAHQHEQQQVVNNDAQPKPQMQIIMNQQSPQPKQQHHEHQQHHYYSPLTKVNGKGLWRSWKRNFQSKLLALMDLIDNSLDAALRLNNSNNNGCSSTDDDFIGRVHVHPDLLYNNNSSSNSTTTTTTGIILVNNSHSSIRPLQRILEVYNSSKTHSGSVHIGENGVGLKQGAATLSDLTFVLVKKKMKKRKGRIENDDNNDDDNDDVLQETEEEEGVIELGLIAESLQREEGCCLPAFTFPISNDGGKQDITNLLSNPNKAEIAACVAQYGDNSLERGIDRLSKHFYGMCFGTIFGNDDNVFCLILDRVDYGHAPTTESKCSQLLKDLRMEIPRFYLHVPWTFDFRIGSGGVVTFDYWQQRLVEFSSISVLMNHSSYWHEYRPESDPGAYKMRVLIGFDRYRTSNKSLGKEGSLYIYSRKSGRLIKCMPDGRGYLGLGNTGSMYCQGLTIIIDDIGGQLPLNPTKQGIAFAEQTNGAIHEENLIAHVGFLAKTYYKYHLDKFRDRTELTQMIKDFGNGRVEVGNSKDIDSSELTTFEYKTTGHLLDGRKKIRFQRGSLKIKSGCDTRLQLIPRSLLIPPSRIPSPRPLAQAQVVDTRRDDQNGSRKRRASEIMTGRERVAFPAQPSLNNNVAVRNTFQPIAKMAGHNNIVAQQTRPLSNASARGKTLNHLVAMQQNDLQHQQHQQPIQPPPPMIQQPLLYQQPQPSSNALDPQASSIVNSYKVVLERYKSQLKQSVAKIQELQTKNAKIQELQATNEQLMDAVRKKDAQVQRLEAETTSLKRQLIGIVQNRAEVETSEMI